MIAEASENREVDRKPSFVPFAILNGVLTALVLACISVNFFLLHDWIDRYGTTVVDWDLPFYYIRDFFDLTGPILHGFIAVAERNGSSIDDFLNLLALQLVAQAPTILITEIVKSLVYLPQSLIVNEKIKIARNVLNLMKIVSFIAMYFLGRNLYEKVQRIDNTNPGRIRHVRFNAVTGVSVPSGYEPFYNEPQNQESPA